MATSTGHRGRGRRNKGDWRDKSKSNQERDGKPSKEGESHADDSPIVKAFRVFQKELDNRNDRFERIFKLSRDITIESKRLIFLLQRVIGSDDPEKLLAEAAEKIHELHSTKFLEIAKELEGQDSYQYLRAYTSGLQEYIEAVTFYYYLSEQRLVNLDKIQKQLIFPKLVSVPVESSGTDSQEAGPDAKQDNSDPSCSDDQPKPMDHSDDNAGNSSTKPEPTGSVSPAGASEDKKTMLVHVPPSEYMLGVADFTGELMRMAINSVGAGNLDTPRVVADMMRVIHNAFTVFDNASRELRKKTSVLRQSLQKVETACYTLTVRGSEIPQHMLTDVFTSTAASGENFNVDDVEEPYD
ncbi:translin-associated protein X [Aplysia californica]|uniref:Translin-associated protein X n=1 Tax=Aplysia californica TaxID=6500 RepID=A0ABM0JNL4_APLCA|nr:translin-associated protein X [Aplysia californica]